MEENSQPKRPIKLDRAQLKLDLKFSISNQYANQEIIATPLSAPARSHFFVDQPPKPNLVISRRGVEAWKKALASAAPGTTMCVRNREKSPIESLQRIWEDNKRDGARPRTSLHTPQKRKSSSFLRKPASSIRRFYQRATSFSLHTPSQWQIVNTAFTTAQSTPTGIKEKIHHETVR